MTSRYSLADIAKWKGARYREQEVERLGNEDARELLKKIGVTGSQAKIDDIVQEYGGHALSLTLLGKYLVEDFNGDITKAKAIPPFPSDTEAGGKAHRILVWYDRGLEDAQRAFMKVFSLFRRSVDQADFEQVFCSKMETAINEPMTKLKTFSFMRMVENLCERRLIARGQNNTYTTHPLIRNYFDSTIESHDKSVCHKKIYDSTRPQDISSMDTAEKMHGLLDRVYHGCAAGLHDEVFKSTYTAKIDGVQIGHWITHILGAWQTDLTLLQNFFEDGNFSQLPLLNDEKDQGTLLTKAALDLLNIGRLDEAERLLLTAMKVTRDAADRFTASLTLADLLLRKGEIRQAREVAKNASKLEGQGERLNAQLIMARSHVAWMSHLLGEEESAKYWFERVDQLEQDQYHRPPQGLRGIFYADYLVDIGEISKAHTITEKNLEFSHHFKFINFIAMCYRCLSSIERTRRNYDEAEKHLANSLQLSGTVGRADDSR